MTKQEYIKKESEKYKFKLNQTFYAEGLSKGLEIAEAILDFAVNRYFSVERLDGKTYWAKPGETKSIQYLTTAELLNIYLTENEKNNVDKNS